VRLGRSAPGLVRVDRGPPAPTRALHLDAYPDTVRVGRAQAVIEGPRAGFDAHFGAGGGDGAPTV
jgi:hypothetical protein